MLIGIAGSGPCTGVTHFSILTGNYLAGVEHRKIAILEWNDSGDFERIQEIYSKKSVTNHHGQTFTICGVCYCKNADRNDLMECERQKYDAVVLDFGAYGDRVEDEFMRCDRRFFLGSFSEWQLGAFAELISLRHAGGWEYFTVFGNEDAADMMRRCLNVRAERIPWLPDAFTITGEAMAFFGRFLTYRRGRG